MFKDSKSFEKVVTLDCQDYRCLEQGIMTYIILGLDAICEFQVGFFTEEVTFFTSVISKKV